MPKKVALITIHGMGEEDKKYFEPLEKRLKKKLGKKWAKVSFQNVQYASVLQNPENQLWGDIKNCPDNDIDAIRLRKFILYGFGDAGSLEFSAHDKKNNHAEYIGVQRRIQCALLQAYDALEEDPSMPVVIIAQSLGCQIISNYLWDAANHKYIFKDTDDNQSGEQEFLKLKSLRHLITTGCNIPLFIAGLKKRDCFKAPNTQFKWDNYYDPDDVLGWPLKQLGESFNQMVEDHAINAGGFFTSWNPCSHTKYWTDNDVLDPLFQTLKSLIITNDT